MNVYDRWVLPPILDQIKVEAGYEMALAAALGDDLDAPVADAAPVHWRLNAARDAGTFATVNLPVLAAGLGWQTDTLYTDGTLRIIFSDGSEWTAGEILSRIASWLVSVDAPADTAQ